MDAVAPSPNLFMGEKSSVMFLRRDVAGGRLPDINPREISIQVWYKFRLRENRRRRPYSELVCPYSVEVPLTLRIGRRRRGAEEWLRFHSESDEGPSNSVRKTALGIRCRRRFRSIRHLAASRHQRRRRRHLRPVGAEDPRWCGRFDCLACRYCRGDEGVDHGREHWICVERSRACRAVRRRIVHCGVVIFASRRPVAGAAIRSTMPAAVGRPFRPASNGCPVHIRDDRGERRWRRRSGRFRVTSRSGFFGATCRCDGTECLDPGDQLAVAAAGSGQGSISGRLHGHRISRALPTARGSGRSSAEPPQHIWPMAAP